MSGVIGTQFHLPCELAFAGPPPEGREATHGAVGEGVGVGGCVGPLRGEGWCGVGGCWEGKLMMLMIILMMMMMYNIVNDDVQCHPIQCNALQYNAIQYNAMQCNASLLAPWGNLSH